MLWGVHELKSLGHLLQDWTGGLRTKGGLVWGSWQRTWGPRGHGVLDVTGHLQQRAIQEGGRERFLKI